jgi:glycosyltransferase involved in cell wall biosynthesis
MQITGKKIFVIYHGRFPAERAAALFAAKCAESFHDLGLQTTLLVPRRFKRSQENYSEYFGMKNSFKVVFLPTLDLFFVPFLDKIAFIVNFLTFSKSCLWYLLFNAKKEDIIYSNESMPLFFVSFFFSNTVYEIHDFPKSKKTFYSILLRRVGKIIVTNLWKKEKIKEQFNISENKIMYEPNAVDLDLFSTDLSIEKARDILGLPQDKYIVTYVGQLRTMGMEKGIDTVFSALKKLPAECILLLVGGSEKDILYYKNMAEKEGVAERVIFTGFVKNSIVPMYLKASDVLLAPFPKNDHYEFYMSPMKIFEYMASSRPIVASDLNSIREILTDDYAVFASPSDPDSLVRGVEKIKNDKAFSLVISRNAREKIENHSWKKRAERILSFI